MTIKDEVIQIDRQAEYIKQQREELIEELKEIDKSYRRKRV